MLEPDPDNIVYKDGDSEPTAPVSMSYMRVPRLHQSTAFPWPIRCRISGALCIVSTTERGGQ